MFWLDLVLKYWFAFYYLSKLLRKKYVVLLLKSFQESNVFLLSSTVVSSELFPDSGLFLGTNYLLFTFLSSLVHGNAEPAHNAYSRLPFLNTIFLQIFVVPMYILFLYLYVYILYGLA